MINCHKIIDHTQNFDGSNFDGFDFDGSLMTSSLENV